MSKKLVPRSPVLTPLATPERRFLKARALAARLGVHPKTLFRWAKDGRITSRKLGPRTVLFDEAEVFALVDSCRI